MSSIEISEDESSMEQDLILSLSTDYDGSTEPYDNLTSDDDLELPNVNLNREKALKALFPTSYRNTISDSTKKGLPPPSETLPKDPGFERMIGAVKVHLPVNPYGCQIALISKVITAIKTSQNCLLESPTGSGKTLALLCGVLAWQQQERARLQKIQAETILFPEENGMADILDFSTSSPSKKNTDSFFTKTSFGEKSIYDKTTHGRSGDVGCSTKRPEAPYDYPGSPNKNLVSIHKKRRLPGGQFGEDSKTKQDWSFQQHATENPNNVQQKENQDTKRVPIIYYGARTHKQIQQVVKEFRRTYYCGDAKMTVLSSRDYSCIREFDRQRWSTKNDMCRGCVKTFQSVSKSESNCKFYDNRNALNHKSLPPAFDLEDLVSAGQEMDACPYYAARAMAQAAHIVFCPYNYIIEPSIRSSMSIDLNDNILVIDEAHNIEDICRDAATFTYSRDNILAALKELEIVSGYRYASEVCSFVDNLIKTLKNWDQWFVNQLPLVNQKPLIYNEAVHTWPVEHFIDTLNNHNIGLPHYNDFRSNTDIFCRKLREDPRTLFGVSQATGTLLESIGIVLGYLFRDECKFVDDFKPALIKTVAGGPDSGWRNSQFNQSKETLSLKLICMNPAVVFEDLKKARCIILASGTLTPMGSFKSELNTEFNLAVSPPHVIPKDRVWIGTLTTLPDGRRLECKSKDTDLPETQDGLGEAVLWVSQVTPNGVLCFLPSYQLMNKLLKRWQETNLWSKLESLKHVFMESRNVKDHNDIMEDYYKYVGTEKGALLIAVYRGKVSEGMDFKDHQARAVVTIGVPYPSTFDMAVNEKMKYNNKYAANRGLLAGNEWLRIQAYRALNQAAGRCVRHRNDWGAVLLVDARFQNPYYTEHLSKWLKQFLGNNHHTYESLINSPNSLDTFMQNMSVTDSEDI